MNHMKNLSNLKNPKNTLAHQKKIERRAKRAYSAFVCAVIALTTIIIPAAAAANQPLQIVQNLSDFIFSLIRAIGMILLGYGILRTIYCLYNLIFSSCESGKLLVISFSSV